MKALLSVYDKTGIVEFARALHALGVDILASGGTAAKLAEAGIPVTDIASIVGKPILGHKVVTLSREIHAGLLADEGEQDALDALGIARIELLRVDLYPLEAEIARDGATPASVLAKTDIGGPAMLRAAAKGRRIVVSDAADHERVLAWLKEGQPDGELFRAELAAKAEFLCARYALSSARATSGGRYDGVAGERALACTYGENAWQTPAALCRVHGADPLALDRFALVEGSPPSYNNLCDLDRALQTLTHAAAAFKGYTDTAFAMAVGVKHGNACGAAWSASDDLVAKQVVEGDPLALFGGMFLANFPLEGRHAEILSAHRSESRRILDTVVAPSVTKEAVEILARKGGKCRILVNPALASLDRSSLDTAPRFRYVRGGFLRQPNYGYVLDLNDPDLERHGHLGDSLDWLSLLLAWAVGSTANSNTITLVQRGKVVGNGVGQQDRVGAAKLAVARARERGHDTAGTVAYSDSFFPFPDGVEVLAQAGVRAILATRGSVKDKEVVKRAKALDVAFWTLPDAKARGFFGH